MNKKAFIIILETNTSDSIKLRKLIEALKKDKDVSAWWHHISNTLMIITNPNVSANSIQKYVRNYFPDTHFMVLQIKAPQDYDGWLPQNAWSWIANSLNRI